jgi:hypothetical protein
VTQDFLQRRESTVIYREQSNPVHKSRKKAERKQKERRKKKGAGGEEVGRIKNRE